MEGFASYLMDIAERAGMASVKQIAKRPGVQSVYRATAHPASREFADVVVTTAVSLVDDLIAEAVYVGCFGNRPIIRKIDQNFYREFAIALTALGFDHLNDDPSTTSFGANLIMLERASGTYYRSVVLRRSTQVEPYSRIVNALRAFLPETLREMKL